MPRFSALGRGPHSTIFYWDGSERRIKLIGTGTFRIVEAATLLEVDGLKHHWETVFTYGNGNVGRYRFDGILAEDGNGFTLEWTKISGTGRDKMGPFKFKRVDEVQPDHAK